MLIAEGFFALKIFCEKRGKGSLFPGSPFGECCKKGKAFFPLYSILLPKKDECESDRKCRGKKIVKGAECGREKHCKLIVFLGGDNPWVF